MLRIGRYRVLAIVPIVCASFVWSCGGESPAPPTAPTPPALVTLASVVIESTEVIGGQTVGGTVSLTGAAPSGGVLVNFSSSDPAAASVPSSLRIAAGDSKAAFTVSTVAVSRDVGVTISATTTGTPVSAMVMVVAPGALARVELSPDTVSGGQPVQGVVSLTSNAPDGGLVVMLSSDNEAASVPARITIAAGSSKGAFTVTTRASSRDMVVTITASAAGSNRMARLNLVEAKLNGFGLEQANQFGALPVRATVSFTGPPAIRSIRVTSSEPSAVASADIPVTISGNNASFSINTAAVMSDKTVTLTVDCCGGVYSTSLRLLPMFVLSDRGIIDLKTRHFMGSWFGFGVPNRVVIDVHPYNVFPDSSVSWHMAFGTPNGSRLEPGHYTTATGAVLEATSPDDGCIQIVGDFDVLEAVYGSRINTTEYGRLERFHATFRRECTFGNRVVLSGEVYVTAPPPDYRDPVVIP